MASDGIVYRDDHTIVRTHVGTKVAVQTGVDPEEATPSIVDAVELQSALREFLNSEVSDGGE